MPWMQGMNTKFKFSHSEHVLSWKFIGSIYVAIIAEKKSIIIVAT